MSFIANIKCFFGKHEWDHFRADRCLVRVGHSSEKLRIPNVRHRECVSCGLTEMQSISNKVGVTSDSASYWVPTQYDRNDPLKMRKVSDPEPEPEPKSETHQMFVIGRPGFFRCFVDVSKHEAIDRYANLSNMTPRTVERDMVIRSGEFKEEFVVEDILFLDE